MTTTTEPTQTEANRTPARHTVIVEPCTLVPGSVGWRVSQLDDPQTELLFTSGRYEIINGVLTPMAAAHFDPNVCLFRLVLQISTFQALTGLKGTFAPECDIIFDDLRLVVADFVWVTPEQSRVQRRIAAERQKRDARRSGLYVPPTLVIESISYGHQDHDRVTKFAWYAEFGVAHYWIFDALNRTLDCFALQDGKYGLVARGENDGAVAAPLFEGLTLELAKVWTDE